jgi:MoaA/NifB/PqqE/SkfB family radical SAM enzyme
MLGTEPSPAYRIDRLKAPLFVSWQITRDCDLSCIHCCTGSAPGKRLPDELSAEEALSVAADLIRNEVPYVMLCGGEPLIVPHFLALAERLGSAGIQLKIETNGQRLDGALTRRLAALTVRSVQVSLDGDTQAVYARQRPGASLDQAHAACQRISGAGLPLEVTFAPTRLNIHEVRAVIERASDLGAFRFSTGRLMRMGTAARRWDKLAPSPEEYRAFCDTLRCANGAAGRGRIELRYTPFSVVDALRGSIADPPATLLVLPNGWVKVAAAIPHICADLRRHTLAQAWARYRSAWRDVSILAALRRAIEDESSHAESNTWRMAAAANH